jgi:glycosyltransferase involved in cell wall biosynthesis
MMEGWGITTIEANACGTPVVASNVPGLRESVRNPHTGFLVPFGNVEKFVEKVQLLLEDEKVRKDMEKSALEWAGRFDWEASAKAWLALLS